MNKNKELHKYVSWDEYPVTDPDDILIFLSVDHQTIYEIKNKIKVKYYLLWDQENHNIELKINGAKIEVPFDIYSNGFDDLAADLMIESWTKKHIPNYNRRFFDEITKKFKSKLFDK